MGYVPALLFVPHSRFLSDMTVFEFLMKFRLFATDSARILTVNIR